MASILERKLTFFKTCEKMSGTSQIILVIKVSKLRLFPIKVFSELKQAEQTLNKKPVENKVADLISI